MTQPQHLSALCFVCALKNLTTQADRPLPGLHVDHEGCSCLSMLSLARLPATIASERACTHSHTLSHSFYSSSQWERDGEERLPAAPRRGAPDTLQPSKHTHAPNKGELSNPQTSMLSCAFRRQTVSSILCFTSVEDAEWGQLLQVEKLGIKKDMCLWVTVLHGVFFIESDGFASILSFVWIVKSRFILVKFKVLELTKQGWLNNSFSLVWREVSWWQQV